jgi:hypothetical protein
MLAFGLGNAGLTLHNTISLAAGHAGLNWDGRRWMQQLQLGSLGSLTMGSAAWTVADFTKFANALADGRTTDAALSGLATAGDAGFTAFLGAVVYSELKKLSGLDVFPPGKAADLQLAVYAFLAARMVVEAARLVLDEEGRDDPADAAGTPRGALLDSYRLVREVPGGDAPRGPAGVGPEPRIPAAHASLLGPQLPPYLAAARRQAPQVPWWAAPEGRTQVSPPASPPAAAPPPAAEGPQVNVTADLARRAQKARGTNLQWRTSVSDLMKLLELDSSLANRRTLAKQLDYRGSDRDTAAMNTHLYKRLMEELAKNNGQLPAELKR